MYMYAVSGWRSWNFMKQNVSQPAILDQVDALAARNDGRPSLLDAGYTHIGIDDGEGGAGGRRGTERQRDRETERQRDRETER